MKTSSPKILSYGKQSLNDQEIQAVVDVLKSSWISQGPKIEEFERAFADYCGAQYAVAVNNGTAALHLAYIAAGLKLGTEGITTPITFLATSNAMIMTGAKPVFADIQYDTVNIDPAEIARKITKKTKVIAPVHFGGLPVDLEQISKIAKKNRIAIVEDGCHALGAEYQGKKIGSCQFSDMTCFSFHPVKHITTGEGGMITTNRKDLYERLKTLRTHGMIKTEADKKKHGPWYVAVNELGYNYRITDFQCAMGIVQMKKLDSFVARRIEIAKQYDTGFRSLGDLVRLPQVKHSDRQHSWHLYLLRLHKSAGRRNLFDRLWDEGIRLQVHYVPLHLQSFYQKTFKTKKGAFPQAEKYYAEAISLPMYPELEDSDVQRVIETVSSILRDGAK